MHSRKSAVPWLSGKTTFRMLNVSLAFWTVLHQDNRHCFGCIIIVHDIGKKNHFNWDVPLCKTVYMNYKYINWGSSNVCQLWPNIQCGLVAAEVPVRLLDTAKVPLLLKLPQAQALNPQLLWDHPLQVVLTAEPMDMQRGGAWPNPAPFLWTYC